MNSQEAAARVQEHLEAALSKSLSSMTGQRFRVTADETAKSSDLADPILWQQSLSISQEPALWIQAGKALWEVAGEMTLAAVGVDSVTEEDCRSTWQEILSQTTGSFCTSLCSDVQQEITATKGELVDSAPPRLEWIAFDATGADGGVWKLRMGWSPSIPALYARLEPELKNAGPRDSSFSKTFDLLLDVALPVSVSFGKTSLQIREVLKLNTGSIVELNRFVAEPVEVLVNDCVIARGEVVVVDGNYGVRITELSSREDRMKSGLANSSSGPGGR